MDRQEALQNVAALLEQVLQADSRGGQHARLARAHGYVDGYMKAMLEMGILTRDELLQVVRQSRERVRGPAWKVLADDVNASAA